MGGEEMKKWFLLGDNARGWEYVTSAERSALEYVYGDDSHRTISGWVSHACMGYVFGSFFSMFLWWWIPVVVSIPLVLWWQCRSWSGMADCHKVDTVHDMITLHGGVWLGILL